ncbi:MAG: alpha/beta fold hydrolase [Deltaproteobacteria bacterium]|jgi:pimeloyl-ACP methyl ester carboxylesterase|nr:alpha/beta fold hydrolase [Deltaproteobacteria bacterium]
MVAFLIFLGVLYLAGALAVTLPYWYERENADCADIPSPRYSPRAVVRLWLEAAWAFLLLLVAFPLDPIARRLGKTAPDKDEDGLPPVLLVHGLYHHPSGWLYLRRALRKAGFRNIRTVAYSSWNTSIEKVTAVFDKAVEGIEREYAGQKPLLVGHSLGGLIIRNWLAEAGNGRRALGALTLATPHQGSKMAGVAFGALGRSLTPANPFFAELARREGPAPVPCVALVSEADTMVLPQKNLVPVTSGWTMRLAPYATHAGMLTKGAVLRMAAWELHRMITDAARPVPAPSAAKEESGTEPAPQPSGAQTQPEPRPEPRPEPQPNPQPEPVAAPTGAAPARKKPGPKPRSESGGKAKTAATPAMKAAAKTTAKTAPDKPGKKGPKEASQK